MVIGMMIRLSGFGDMGSRQVRARSISSQTITEYLEFSSWSKSSLTFVLPRTHSRSRPKVRLSSGTKT